MEPAVDNASSDSPAPVIAVMFCLLGDGEDDWPPYPAELLPARQIAPHLAELTGSPWFVSGVSRGDVVAVTRQGDGYIAGETVLQAGHSTIRVIAASVAELGPLAERIRRTGVEVALGKCPPMLSVDIAAELSLEPVIDILHNAESLTCAYEISCQQHRH